MGITSESTIKKIISGGQTGADRGALDAAIAAGVGHGGWCPLGRRAEDGPIPENYVLQVTSSPDYAVRTEQNVIDSDGTLILCRGAPTGGTELTCKLARRYEKPLLVVDLDESTPLSTVQRWLETHQISILNVAGPRESQCPGITAAAEEFVKRLLRERDA